MKILDSYFENCAIVTIDIETTGLFPERDCVIVGGLIEAGAGSPGVAQFFSETPDDEESLLRAFMPKLEAADVIISFNGDAFDIPFLNRRLARHGLPGKIPPGKSFDLYRIIRQAGFSGILPDLRQTTVERYLGIAGSRTDRITGQESAALYRTYLRTKAPELKEAILLHNADDLRQLERLMAILRNIDLHRAMFLNGFNVIENGRKIRIRGVRLIQGAIVATGHHTGLDADYVSYAKGYAVRLSSADGSLRIKIPVRREQRHEYVDLQDFDFDAADFERYANYRSGYLIVSTDGVRHHAEINCLIKRICREILRAF